MHKQQQQITIGMSDEERYELLKDRTIDVPFVDTDKLAQIGPDDYDALERIGKSGAFKILRKIGEDFGMFRDYTTQDVEFEFAFSRNNLYESIHKQQRSFQNYAKMMTVLEKVIETAIGVEVHRDRYSNPDNRVSGFYIFVSAFRNSEQIVPVLLEIKTYTDNTTSSLYVAVSLHEIDRSRIVGYTPGEKHAEPYPLPASSTVSLADLFSNVNVSDKNLLKYIPDGFLNDMQKEAKQIALKETADYIEKKNKQRLAKHGEIADSDWFVSEPGVEYQRDEASIVFIFRKRAA